MEALKLEVSLAPPDTSAPQMAECPACQEPICDHPRGEACAHDFCPECGELFTFDHELSEPPIYCPPCADSFRWPAEVRSI